MPLACLVALEPVLVSTLLLAHFAIPAKLAQTFRLDSVADSLGRQEAVFRHFLVPLFIIDLCVIMTTTILL